MKISVVKFSGFFSILLFFNLTELWFSKFNPKNKIVIFLASQVTFAVKQPKIIYLKRSKK